MITIHFQLTKNELTDFLFRRHQLIKKMKIYCFFYLSFVKFVFFSSFQRITWNPSDTDRELCLLKGKSEVKSFIISKLLINDVIEGLIPLPCFVVTKLFTPSPDKTVISFMDEPFYWQSHF